MSDDLLARALARRSEWYLLTVTRTLAEQDKQFPEWASFFERYQKLDDSKNRLWVSVLNSAVCQRTKVFVLTRNSAIELIKNDQNWEKGGLSQHSYAGAIEQMLSLKVVTVVQEGKGQRPAVYKIADPQVLEHLGEVDEAAQEARCLNYVNNMTDEDVKKSYEITEHRNEHRNEHRKQHRNEHTVIAIAEEKKGIHGAFTVAPAPSPVNNTQVTEITATHFNGRPWDIVLEEAKYTMRSEYRENLVRLRDKYVREALAQNQNH